jgi:cysteinyl-tRNA synthetase
MLKRCAIACCVLLLAMATAARAQVGVYHPDSLAYVLQADRLARTRAEAVAALAGCGRQLIVIDASYTGGERWTTQDIAAIRAGLDGRRVVAYLSIGEAEKYRDYWQRGWKPGNPAWLGKRNPQWAGNFVVNYWDPQWQQLIVAELDLIVAAGFDGVYLDLVDAFETFEYDRATKQWLDDRVNPATQQSYRRDMIDWVLTLAERARQTSPDFLVIPQNGVQLLEHADFLAAIDLVSVEDLFTSGNRQQDEDDTDYRLSFLAAATEAGRTVVCVEYPRKAKAQLWAEEGADAQAFTLLITDRNLTQLGYCPLAE